VAPQSSLLRIPSATSMPPPLASPHAPRIVAIGGGTGLPVVLHGLRAALAPPHATDADIDSITAIVTVTDDGGNSGWIRRELGTLPPGDIRNCLAALADGPFARLLQHRFADTRELSGHSLGNLMLAGLAQITGDFAEAVNQISALLSARGRVLPSTRESIRLRACFDTGEVIEGERAIAERHQPIRRLSLERAVRPLPEAIRALINADGIVVGPGSLYTSVLPNLLVDGIAPTISGVNAVRIYVANLMTEPGETDGYSLDDHLRVLHEHVGMQLFDYVLVNTQAPAPMRAAGARLEGEPVVYSRPLEHAGGAAVASEALLSEMPAGEIRHTPDRLGAAILRLVASGRPKTPEIKLL